MKQVRALDKTTGEFLKILHANDLTPERRYAFHYSCLSPVCSQSYHWRKSHRIHGNKIQIPATFVENYTSKHNAGCRYDFEKIAAGNSDVAFYQNGAFHLKINFPMGRAHSDLYVPIRHVEPEKLLQSAAQDRTSMPGLGSMGAVVKFLEKEFGSIEASQTDILKLHYQGHNFDWSTVFAASDRYEKIINVPREAVTRLNEARLTIVRLSHEIPANAKGKARFACELQHARISGRLERVQPVLVSGTSELNDVFRQFVEWKATAFIASRPFRPSSFERSEFKARKTMPISLYVGHNDQIAMVSADYWRPRPAVQLGLDLG